MVRYSILSSCVLFLCPGVLPAQELPVISGVERQPLEASVDRLVQAMEFLGEPFSAGDLAAIGSAKEKPEDKDAIATLQKTLDKFVIATVHINAESRVKVAAGPAPRKLVQQGWSLFLVKVHNEAGITPQLKCTSPNAAPIHKAPSYLPRGDGSIKEADVRERWLDVQMFDNQPLAPKLSGLDVEYRILQIYSRDAGEREASIAFNVGQGTQDIGFRNEVALLFDCAPAVKVMLDVVDHDGKPTMGQFVFKDKNDRVYPARSRRLAPDFFFHDQIYRYNDEHVLLPPGTYQVTFSRGPEYRVEHREIVVPDAKEHRELFRLNRWIHMTDYNWFSGDHHIHAAGCAHYDSPTEGVTPQDMMRHILGEDLNVGCVLSWGPCWYHQKSFFEGGTSGLSQDGYLMRYDVEVSGFPSSHAGHLCLLNLSEDDYTYPEPVEFDFSYGDEKGHFSGTKTKQIGEWPSWDLPVLKWGKEQGGIVGFSHSGWGLEMPDNDLPSYGMPPFDGIGANEYIVDVCHGVCDFISTVDTPITWELNIWYHTLNCGYECRISGETDFPCIYGDRVGLGRVYVQLDQGQQLTYENWINGIRDGRSYVGDGLSHLFEFNVNAFELGSPGKNDRPSVLQIKKGEPLKIRAKAAALLGEDPDEELKSRSLNQKPYWHIERARIGGSRKVPVELIVNGKPVARKEIDADGDVEDIEFDYEIERSSWVALRIMPSSHTNPIFVEVDGKPIRASRRSAQWCLDAVDVCWNAKKGEMREHELPQAEAAYDFARDAYRKIIEQSFDDRE